jgi:hypothetical protein
MKYFFLLFCLFSSYLLQYPNILLTTTGEMCFGSNPPYPGPLILSIVTTTPLPFLNLGYACHSSGINCDSSPRLVQCGGFYSVNESLCISNVTFNYLISTGSKFSDQGMYYTGNSTTSICSSEDVKSLSSSGSFGFYVEGDKTTFTSRPSGSNITYNLLSIQWQSTSCLKCKSTLRFTK